MPGALLERLFERQQCPRKVQDHKERTTMSKSVTIVVGLGEVGEPLHEILRQTYDCVGVDIEPVCVTRPCSFLHICIPYQVTDFVGVTAGYIAKYNPRFTVINSTVAPGTTQAVGASSRSPVVYSPVRGKHARMQSDLLHYRKFIGADNAIAGNATVAHFARAGFVTDLFPDSTTGEVAKLLETTWLGVLVGWAQEVERIGRQYGASYDVINAFVKEIDFLPHHITPGVIGGHCVMPNIEILRSQYRSQLLEGIVESNARKAREAQPAVPLGVKS
jgi:UDP-N-acetyl-D-mannosaminuronate dehydrogenase